MTVNDVTDLYETTTPDGFNFQSWKDGDTIYVTFGMVTIAIPQSEFDVFVEGINQTNSALGNSPKKVN